MAFPASPPSQKYAAPSSIEYRLWKIQQRRRVHKARGPIQPDYQLGANFVQPSYSVTRAIRRPSLEANFVDGAYLVRN